MKGKIKIKVQGQAARPKWEQNLLRRALENGEYNDNALRFQCRIAEDTKITFQGGVETADGDTLRAGKQASFQFGRNVAGNAYLTAAGLVSERTGERMSLTWEGDAVPLAMQRVAVAHDEGRKVAAKTIVLDLARATVRYPRKGDKRKNHDTDKHGRPYRRRERTHHNRLCMADLPSVN